jgi:hypothetical protein
MMTGTSLISPMMAPFTKLKDKVYLTFFWLVLCLELTWLLTRQLVFMSIIKQPFCAVRRFCFVMPEPVEY